MRELRGVVWIALFGAVVLPATLAVTLGLGFLLNSLGDVAGWNWCARAAMAIGVVWVVSLATTAVGAAVLALDAAPPPRRSEAGQSHGPRPNASSGSAE